MVSEMYQRFARVGGYAKALINKRRMTGDGDILDILRSARRKGRLTLVLGAGVSYDSKIPDWKELIRRAIDRALVPPLCGDLSNVSEALDERLITAVRFMENIVGSQPAFRLHLLDALYHEFDENARNSTLDAVVRFACGLDGGTPVQAVITYNFDDIVECRIRKQIATHALPLRVVTVNSHRNSRTGAGVIRILHVHGLLPQPSSVAEISQAVLEQPIVLSEQDYHRHYADARHWANRLQCQKYSSTHCLFVGLSFTDANLRRCLDSAARIAGRTVPSRHGAILRSCIDGMSLPTSKLFLKTDMNSFGVEPLWINNFQEIPSVLAQING